MVSFSTSVITLTGSFVGLLAFRRWCTSFGVDLKGLSGTLKQDVGSFVGGFVWPVIPVGVTCAVLGVPVLPNTVAVSYAISATGIVLRYIAGASVAILFGPPMQFLLTAVMLFLGKKRTTGHCHNWFDTQRYLSLALSLVFHGITLASLFVIPVQQNVFGMADVYAAIGTWARGVSQSIQWI